MNIPAGTRARRHFQHVVRGCASRAVRPTHRRTFLLTLSAALTVSLFLAYSAQAQPSHESIEWCDIWISHANETNLPRVLLIGDSIVRDYYSEVEKQLAGKAFVGRL